MTREDKALYGYMLYLLTKQFNKKELFRLINNFYKMNLESEGK